MTNRASIIKEAKARFGIRIIDAPERLAKQLRGSATAHQLCYHHDLCGPNPPESRSEYLHFDDADFFLVRNWFFEKGWLLTLNPLRDYEAHYLLPIDYVEVSTLFHAAPVKNRDSILEKGLEKGTREMLNTDRLDPIGFAYASPELGKPGDLKNKCFGTAHYWAERLQEETKDESAWCIFGLDIANSGEVICFEDPWSKTGIALRPKASIKATLVYPTPAGS